MMEYKGYQGKVEFDDEDNLFHGEVLNIRDVITFQGQSVDEILTEFRASIDDYLAFCEQRGEEPEKPCTGQIIADISPELHRQANMAAAKAGKSLNAWIVDQLENAIVQLQSKAKSPSLKPSQKNVRTTPSRPSKSRT